MGKNQKKCNLRKSPSQWIKWKFLPFQKEKNVSFLHNVVILKRLIFTYLMQYFSNFFGPLWNIYREHMGLHSSQWIQFWNELFDMLKNFCYCGRIVTHQRILWLIKSFYYCMFVEVKISSRRYLIKNPNQHFSETFTDFLNPCFEQCMANKIFMNLNLNEKCNVVVNSCHCIWLVFDLITKVFWKSINKRHCEHTWGGGIVFSILQ